METTPNIFIFEVDWDFLIYIFSREPEMDIKDDMKALEGDILIFYVPYFSERNQEDTYEHLYYYVCDVEPVEDNNDGFTRKLHLERNVDFQSKHMASIAAHIQKFHSKIKSAS